MKNDTPLEEVAQHLPAATARGLLNYPIPLQTAVLTVLRSILTHWEEVGLELDPIDYGTVVDGVVAGVTICIDETRDYAEKLFAVSSQLAIADNLIESLGQALAQLQQEGQES